MDCASTMIHLHMHANIGWAAGLQCIHGNVLPVCLDQAARGPQYIAAFLARPCKDNEGSLLRHNNMDHHWGCSYKPSAPEANASKAMTNKDALLAMTNNTYLFGVNNSDGVFKSVPDDKVCKQAGLEGATCGYFTSTATGLLSGGGCHYNMVLTLACSSRISIFN
jgi:hypothetical protein